MKKYKSKYRIHTFVLKRRAYYLLIGISLMLLVATLSGYYFKNKTSSIYKNLGQLCIDSVMMNIDKINMPDFKNFEPGPEAIMSQASVIFTKYSAIESDGFLQKESVHATDMSKKEVKEKSVKSENTEIKNETDYIINKEELLSDTRVYSAKGDKPKVLIVHTHGCETYSSENGTGLGNDGSYRTLDVEKNMVKIGEVIASVLKDNGINVLHDKTLCDYPSYNSSYVKSLGVTEWYMERYPEIEFVFDIHRDAIEDENGIPTKLTANIGGKKSAQAMIVCGTDASGLSNPNWKDNLTLALKIQKNLEAMYPGLMRPINLRKERFNMHKTKGSLLFEVGTHGNTLEEAIYAAENLAKGIVLTIS